MKTEYQKAMRENLEIAKIKTKMLNFCNKQKWNKEEFLDLVNSLNYNEY